MDRRNTVWDIPWYQEMRIIYRGVNKFYSIRALVVIFHVFNCINLEYILIQI
jgi:hypothetical protein